MTTRYIKQWMVPGDVDQHIVSGHNSRGFRYYHQEYSEAITIGGCSAVADEYSEQSVLGVDRDRSNMEEELEDIKVLLPKLRGAAEAMVAFMKEARASEISHEYKLKEYEDICKWGCSLARRKESLERMLQSYEEVEEDVPASSRDFAIDNDSSMKPEYNVTHWNIAWWFGEKTFDIVLKRVIRERRLPKLYALNARINVARMGKKDEKRQVKGNMPYYWYAKCKALIEGRIAVLNPNSRTLAQAMKWREKAAAVADRPNKPGLARDLEVEFNPDARMSGRYSLTEDALISIMDRRSSLSKQIDERTIDEFIADLIETDEDEESKSIIELYATTEGNISAMARAMGVSWHTAKRRLVAVLEDALLWQ